MGGRSTLLSGTEGRKGKAKNHFGAALGEEEEGALGFLREGGEFSYERLTRGPECAPCCTLVAGDSVAV